MRAVEHPVPRCAQSFTDCELSSWLDVLTLTGDVVLNIQGTDLYDSHTALRHVQEINKAGYSIDVELPMHLRKHRAFTPWLQDGHTVSRPKASKQPVILSFTQKPPPHMQERGPHAHKTSFDMRIGGAMVRTLLDSGANVSVISKQLLSRLGMAWQKGASTDSVGGIGGHVKTYGTADVAVKLGKYHPVHTFQVVEEAISGYECIIGDDFLHTYGIFLEYHETVIKARVFGGRPTEYVALQRKVAPPVLQPQINALNMEQETQDGSPGSWSEYKKYKHDIESGAQVAYRIHLLSKELEDGQANSTDSAIPTHLPQVIQEVIKKHSGPEGTLAGKIPPHTHAVGYECHIELIEGAKPVYVRQYRLTPLEREELINRIQEFIEKGWIEPSSSSWSSSVLFIPKPNGKLRFCVDFRHLNSRTLLNRGPIPNQGELLDNLQGSTVFSALDLASGFYQIAMAEDSKALTAFPTPFGLYQWCVMPMGLSNAPAIFQQAMNAILREHILGGYCLVYLDDIIIKSENMEMHALHLDKVLASLHKHHLFCQLPKCTWAQSQLKYLGHIVNGQGVQPDPAKVKALEGWEPPLKLVAQLAEAMEKGAQKEATSLKEAIATECRRFLGFMNYFNRFIPKYSELACDLHGHTQKSPPEWTVECTEAWNKLKHCLQHATMMFHPDFTLPFHVFSDASTKAIGGVLIQYKDGVAYPIAYVARKLTSAEVNYTTTEQEMLAMVYCFTQWRCYLEGSRTLLHTDHEPLTWLAKQERPNRRQARWMEFLAGFTYEVLYVKGDRNIVADALSRMLTPPDAQELVLPGDNWPMNADSRPHQRLRTTCSLSLGRSDDAQPGPSRDYGARPSAGYAGTYGIDASALYASGQAPKRSGHSPAPATAPSVCASERSAATGPTGHVDESTTRCGGFLTSPYHRIVLLGGYTRRSAKRSDDQSPGGGASRRGTKRRVRLADDELDVAHNAPNQPAQHISSTDRIELAGHGNSADETTSPLIIPTGSEVRGAPEPDQPEMSPTLALESDPSLSAYELLAEALFDRISAGTRGDTSVQTDQQRVRLKLREGKRDLLWRDNLLYVPDSEELRQDILYWHHDVPWCGHLGIQKTLELVRRQFWWPGIAADIKNYVQSCYKCQSDKPDRRKKRPPLTFIEAPDSCWRTLGVDLIVDLTPTEPEKYNAIIVFCCFLSKMVRLVPTHTTLTTEGFVELFFREIFPHYGFPTKIVSDRGPQWNSEFFRALCDKADIRLSLSTAYHPQTNGLVERTNEVVETALRHYVSPEQTDWNKKLPFIEFALNDAHKETSGVTPFRMNRITVPLSPFEAVKDRIAAWAELSSPRSELASWVGVSVPKGERTFLQAQEEFARARQSVHWAKCKMKEAHDKQGVVNYHHQIGDFVWLSTKHISLRHPSLRHKFSPKFVGPIKVLEVSANRSTVLLELPSNLQIHPRVSVTLVKPYKARNNLEIQPVWIDGALEWEVEAIINHNMVCTRSKKKQNYVEFLVQWKGNCEPSWHDLKDCENCITTVEHYLTRCTKGVRAKIYKAIPAQEMLWFSETFQREALTLRKK